jgi:hypothetical protein
VHLLALVLIPFDRDQAAIRPPTARDAALWARLDMLLFRYQQVDDDQMWGVDITMGYCFDWWELGGRWDGWGYDVQELMVRQGHEPVKRAMPRFIARNAVWSEDVARVRLISALCPVAIVTPHGEWKQGAAILPSFGKPTLRQRKANAAWRRRIRKVMAAYPAYLAVAVDYHS